MEQADAGRSSVFLFASSSKVRGADVDSEIYLFGYQKNFIKIRGSRENEKNGRDNAEVDKLLEKRSDECFERSSIRAARVPLSPRLIECKSGADS